MKIHLWCCCLLLSFSLGTTSCLAEEALRIDALALFPNQAVLRVNGQQYKLKVGDETAEGVRLVSANSREAVVQYQGQERHLNLSSVISAQFAVPQVRRVVIAPDAKRHYWTSGSINGLPVMLLVDTGATSVAMSAEHASRLGISYHLVGEPGYAQTASGVVPMYRVMLDSVQVGEILVHNVEGAVIEGTYPAEILLGMSFLRNVKIEEVDGTLHLTRNY